jgi:hypothetical protein
MTAIEMSLANLKFAMSDDPDYAWSWHCNLACSMMNEGILHEVANRAAARFMETAFGVDTSQNEHFNEMFAARPNDSQATSNSRPPFSWSANVEPLLQPRPTCRRASEPKERGHYERTGETVGRT